MNLLVHACCGPCAVECVRLLKGEGVAATLFFHNPNIHPFTEYEARKESLLRMARAQGIDAVVHGEYGLRAFLGEISGDDDNRCIRCYEMRLNETARYAREQGFDAFSTTLLISPYQNHEMLISVAQAAAIAHGVAFQYIDFRPFFRPGQNTARSMGLYMQKYCGCIFSEEERYQQKKRKQHKG